tara:strand:+ start:216 stop:818 length:603 start_codon:yes stop_codon:yes gene_type:complete
MLKKKITSLLLGSNNQGKIDEFKELLPKSVTLCSAKSYKINSPVENRKTFRGNSLLKAKYFSKKTNKICLADDSGLEINILNKMPGIYSARWAGKNNNFNIAIKKIFKQLNNKDKNWKKKNIRARFICALTIYWPNGKFITSLGKIDGRISNKKKGKLGFGYDPIFIPEGKKLTFGEISRSEKARIDHRMKAYIKIKKFF